MSSSADNNFRYLRIGRYAVCLDRPVLDAIRTFEFDYEKNRLSSLGVSRKLARAAVKAIIRARLRLLRSDDLVGFPVRGHIGMLVHRGWKVFDFDRGEVTKVFAPDTQREASLAEVAASRRASAIATAPRFIAEDPDRAWFREEYVCGMHATDPEFRNSLNTADFYADVEACLLGLLDCEPPVRVDARVHFDRLANSPFRDRWVAAGRDAGKIDEISAYLEELHRWLVDRGESCELQLVLTHGDFSLVNAISTADGLRFIDWEGIARGGVYSDIFNFLFVERYYDRERGDLAPLIAHFIDKYRAAIRTRFPELQDAAGTDPVFARRQYYLERMRLLVDRDVSPNLGDVVSKSIALFREFDRVAGDVPE